MTLMTPEAYLSCLSMTDSVAQMCAHTQKKSQIQRPPSASGTKSAVVAFGGIQFGDFLPLHVSDTSQYQLRDAITTLNRIRLVSRMDQQHADLAPIITVDGSRRIENSEAMAEGEAATGADLSFPTAGNRGREPGRDQLPFSRLENDRLIQRRT